MALPPHYFFHLLNETKQMFNPSAESGSRTIPSDPSCGMMFVVTKNYDGMRQFFVDLGLHVPPEHPGWAQVTPLLNKGRGCLVFLPNLLLSLEECTDVAPSGPLYLQLEGFDEARLPLLRQKYSVKKLPSGLYQDESYHIVPPDGGLVMALTK